MSGLGEWEVRTRLSQAVDDWLSLIGDGSPVQTDHWINIMDGIQTTITIECVTVHEPLFDVPVRGPSVE